MASLLSFEPYGMILLKFLDLGPFGIIALIIKMVASTADPTEICSQVNEVVRIEAETLYLKFFEIPISQKLGFSKECHSARRRRIENTIKQFHCRKQTALILEIVTLCIWILRNSLH